MLKGSLVILEYNRLCTWQKLVSHYRIELFWQVLCHRKFKAAEDCHLQKCTKPVWVI